MAARVGLLGGTFDPPHLAHLVVAECARVELGLDEVWLLVTGDPWMKTTAADTEHRVAMARLAAEGDPCLRVDDREVRREGPTYTVETLEELAAAEPDTDWWFLLGADAAATLPRWHRADRMLRLARFVAVTRPGHAWDTADALLADVVGLEVPALEISSTDLRRRYATGRATRYLVPEPVDRYVRACRLYGSVPG